MESLANKLGMFKTPQEQAEYQEYCEARAEIGEEPLPVLVWREFNKAVGDRSGR